MQRQTGDKEAQRVVIRASSYLSERSGEDLEKEFDKSLDQGQRHFVIDFRDTEIVNSIGVSIIIGIIEKIMERRGSVHCANLSRVNEEIFSMMGLLRYAPPLSEEIR